MGQVADFVETVTSILTMLLFARAILSWFIRDPSNPIMRFLVDTTEPILGPIRRRLPPMGGFDISMIAAFIGLQIIGQLIASLLRGA